MTGIVNPYQVQGAAPFTVDAVTFDGTNDYMLRGADLNGLANSRKFTLSLWIDQATADAGFILENEDDTFRAYITSDTFAVFAFNAAFNAGVNYSGSPGISGNGWLNFLASFDFDTNAFHIYMNDTDISVGGEIIGSPDNLAFVSTNWSFGAAVITTQKVAADFAEVYFAPGQFLDLSIAANRRKFISADGRPVDIGANGSAPTGVSPAIYFSVRPGDAASDFAINRGAGGNFTITGALTIAATSPSD